MHGPTTLQPLAPPVWLQAIAEADDPGRAAELFWASGPTTPVIGPERRIGEQRRVEVTFLWREPRTAVDVLVHLNGITDAHREDLTPALLDRLPGTDLWHGSYLLPVDGTWGYRIVAEEQLPRDAGRTREGWLGVHRAGQADPRNPRRQPHALGSTSSLLVLPEAYQHPAWGPVPDTTTSSQTWQLTDPDGKPRTVHHARIGTHPRRLLVCFDGEQWLALGLEAALRRAGLDLEVLLIESHSPERRGADLPYPERAAGLLETALDRREQELGARTEPEQELGARTEPEQELGARTEPEQELGARTEPEQVLVAGQSFGGLAAAGCVLLRPDLAREAIVQSGSFWFVPGEEARRDNPVPGELVRRVRAGELDPTRSVFHVQAGTDEGTMVDQARHFHAACTDAGGTADLTVVTGGHDYAWWKHHLLRVLAETQA